MADEEEFEDEEVPNYEWTKEHSIHDFVAFATQLQQAVADFMFTFQTRMAADSNHKVIAEEMRQQVAQEIESLPVFQEPEGTDG